MPVVSYDVATVFKVVDQASKVIAKISKAVTELNDQIEWAQLNLSKLGTKNFDKTSANLKKVQDQVAALTTAVDTSIASMTGVADASAAVARNMAAAAASAQIMQRAASGAIPLGGIRRGGGGGGGGGGYGGFHLRGPGGTSLGGGFHVNHGSMVGQGLLAALGYGIYEQSQLEDFAYRGTFTAGVPANQMKAIEDTIKRVSSKTGFGINDLGEAALDEVRQLGGTGLSWQQKLNVLGPLLTFGAAEGRLKGTTAKEGVDSIIGLAHMLKVYEPEKIAAMADKFAYLSTINPAKLQQMERASGYAVPFLGEIGFDPFQVMMLQTAMMRGGILNTKSGTWLRELGKRALPGTNALSRTAFAKHEGALRALGLVDAKNQPTWFTNGAPDMVKLLEMSSSHLQQMPIAQRAGIMQQLFGSQGAGAMAFLSDPLILKMLPALKEDMDSFRSGSAAFANYGANSPVQQFREAWADLRNVLMDIGGETLPLLSRALRNVDAVLKGANIFAALEKLAPMFAGAIAGGRIAGAPGAVVGGILGAAVPNPATPGATVPWGDWWSNLKQHPWNAFGNPFGLGLGPSSSDDQKKVIKEGTEDGARKGVEDALKHKIAFFGMGGGGGSGVIPAAFTTYGGTPSFGGIGGLHGGAGFSVMPNGRQLPTTTNPGVNPMGSLGGGHANFMHGQFGGPGQNIVPLTVDGHRVAGGINAAASPAFGGFIHDLLAAGAPIHDIGGYNKRMINGTHTWSQHAFGNAIDIDQSRKNVVSPAFGQWAQSHQPELRAALKKWNMISGGDWRSPDFGHFEWSGGSGAAAVAQALQSTGNPNVDAALRAGAAAAGMDLPHFKAMASIESSFNPNSNYNKATQYKGLFQIGRDEWAKYGKGNIYNASDNAMAMASMVNDHRAQFRKMFGRDPTPGELYMIHQQGMGFYTRGAMTNIGGNPYPGMHGPQTHDMFEHGWTTELEHRAHGFGDHDNASSAIPPVGAGKAIVIQHTTKLDGRTVAKNTTKHQARMANMPAHSGRLPDYMASRPPLHLTT